MKGKDKRVKQGATQDTASAPAVLRRESVRLKSGTDSSGASGREHSLVWDRHLRGSGAAVQPWRERLEYHRSGS